MTSTHEVSFIKNGVQIYAEFTQMVKSGRLTVHLDEQMLAEVELVDYDPSYFTDAGLRRAAEQIIKDRIAFDEDLTNFGEDEAPDAGVLALAKLAAALTAVRAPTNASGSPTGALATYRRRRP
jgi:hypothetical protein